jgi:hypothetical protein
MMESPYFISIKYYSILYFNVVFHGYRLHSSVASSCVTCGVAWILAVNLSYHHRLVSKVPIPNSLRHGLLQGISTTSLASIDTITNEDLKQ